MEQNNNAVVLAVIPMENVYATKLLRIGDEVVMNMDEEARGWGRKGVPDGTKGTVVGFFEYHTTRHMNSGKKPGIYRGNGAAVVEWETGEVDTHGSDIAIDKHILDKRREDTVYNDVFDREVRQYDLPKFDYMVGNKVAYTWKPDPRHARGEPQREIGVITSIDFDEIVERRTGQLLDSKVWGHKRVIHVDIEGGGSTRICHAEIEELIEKGNYWAWENDKSQLKFKDLNHEATFYATLGKRRQVRSPRSGNFKWTLDDAVAAVRRGEIDGLGTSGSFFGSKPFPVTYKMDDDLADLSARLRAKTVEGFADHVVAEQPKRRYQVEYTLPDTESIITATKEFDDSVIILPIIDATDTFVLEGYDYSIVPTYSRSDEEDKHVTLLPRVLTTTPKMKDGDGVESEIAITPEIRFDMAIQFFNLLSEKGWLVDDSKFIQQNK